MAILIDTQALVWSVLDSPKLSSTARGVITKGESELCISSVTAFEFVDLNRRGRFGVDLPFRSVTEQLEAAVLDLPAAAWVIAETLPNLHADPIDRILIAHAIHGDHLLVTADRTIRRYPVRTIW